MVKEKTQKAKKEKAPKPKYNMAQNSWFMIKLAWTTGEKKVIVLSLLSALFAVALNLINLYVSPTILSVVERQASVTELILTIVVFVIALMVVSAASSYVNANTLYGRISTRSEIIAQLNKKAATTSYPNIYDEKFKELKIKAQESISSNQAATEAIWTTLTDLTTNIIGFAFYVVLMSSMSVPRGSLTASHPRSFGRIPTAVRRNTILNDKKGILPMTNTLTATNNPVIFNDNILQDVIDVCGYIDLEACFDPVFEPPIDFLEECRKRWETLTSPFRTTIERKIGNTWYVIETECDGNEPLTDKVKRLIFSEKGAICS